MLQLTEEATTVAALGVFTCIRMNTQDSEQDFFDMY
jgi:hypothetical protein